MRRLIHVIGITSILFTLFALFACTATEERAKIRFSRVVALEPFDYRVYKWSFDLRNTPPPWEGAGNCVPVVVELQKRITSTGRMAVIVAVDPPGKGPDHAMLMYAHKKGGKFSRLIDNGLLTQNHPKHNKGLYSGEYGKYLGVCKKPEGNRCVLDEPF